MSGRTSITLPGFASTRRELEPDAKVIVTISEDEDPRDISAVQRVLGDIDTGRLAANRWECTAAQAAELAKLPRLAFFADYTVTDAEAGKVIGDAIIASRATALAMDLARAQGGHRWVHAFPHVANAASNAVCRRLGFERLGTHDVEYPKGHRMRCNDWRLDLAPQAGRP